MEFCLLVRYMEDGLVGRGEGVLLWLGIKGGDLGAGGCSEAYLG